MKKKDDTEKQRSKRKNQKDARRQEKLEKKAARKAEKELYNTQLAKEKATSGNSKVKEKENSSVWDRFKRSKLFDHFWIMSPQNLAMEVHMYGYNFSWKTHIMLLVCSIIGIIAIGLVFNLIPELLVCSAIAVIFLIPNIVRYMYRQMYEQKRFADVTTYMEQMLYSFQKNQKILSSLRETRQLFETGRMLNCIDQAIKYIEAGKTISGEGILKEGLSFIEAEYECTRLITVHQLLINSEEYGGENDNSVLLLQNDIGNWKKRGYVLQAKKKQSNTDNIISIIVATALCAFALFVLNAMANIYSNMVVTDTGIYDMGIIQASSFIYLLVMMLVFMKSLKGLTTNWLDEEGVMDEKQLNLSYRTVQNYDEIKIRKKSIFVTLPFVILSIVAFAYQITWAGILLLGVSVFAFSQYKIGYNLARKDIGDAIYIAMPQWFMQIALLLQNNNVTVAIAKSIDSAPFVLKKELEMMLIRLKEAPEALTSYTYFCKEYDVPEIQSCMKMLHSIAVAGVGNSEKQINSLIERVNQMQDQSDAVRDKHMLFKMKLVFARPILAASIKLLIDLTVGLIYMFVLFGHVGMGGM